EGPLAEELPAGRQVDFVEPFGELLQLALAQAAEQRNGLQLLRIHRVGPPRSVALAPTVRAPRIVAPGRTVRARAMSNTQRPSGLRRSGVELERRLKT